MILFGLVAAAMLGLAIFFILLPLLGNSGPGQSVSVGAVNLQVLQDQMGELKRDHEAGLVEGHAFVDATEEIMRRIDTYDEAHRVAVGATVRRGEKKIWLAALLASILVIGTGGLYQLLGTPAALDSGRLVANGQEIGQQQIAGMVQQLAEKLKQQPGDVAGWAMLARSYFELGRYQEACDAYLHLTELVPTSADYLASYALSMALSRNKNLQGDPEVLLERALKLDPKNIRALSLSGSAAFDRHDYGLAIQFWNQVLPLVAADSDIARSTQSGIDQATSLQKQGEVPSIVRLPEKRSGT